MMKKTLTLVGSVCLILVLAALSLLSACGEEAPAGKLVIATNMEPESLDASVANTSTGLPSLLNIYEMLLDQEPSGERVPGLASWEVLNDGMEIEFTVREGVTFHSGDPLTTEDFVFSFERAQESLTLKSATRYVDSLEVIDDYHFTLHFSKPDVTFIPRRGWPIVSKSYYDRVGEDTFATEPVGTGPYKFVSYVSGYSLDLVVNEDYWGELPSIREVQFRFVTEDTTRVAMLKTGEADIIMECPFPLVEDVTGTPGLKIVPYHVNHPTPSVQFQCFNPDVPWYDKNVRLAIAYAIDADTIVEELLMGIPDRWPRLSPDEVGYDPDIENYPYDPDMALQLLDDAGYADGFDMPLYYDIGRMAMQKETAEAVVLYLEAVGIRAHAEGIEHAQYIERSFAVSEDPEAEWACLAPFPMAGQNDPMTALFLSFQTGGMTCFWSSPHMDELIAEGMMTMDDTARAEIIQEAMRIIHDEVLSITIWNNVSMFAMKDNIDFTPSERYNFTLMLVKDVTID